MFSGDLVEYHSACYCGDAHLADWPRTLLAIESMAPRALVPGRGEALSRPDLVTEAIHLTEEFLKALYGSVTESVAKGLSLKDTFARVREAMDARFASFVRGPREVLAYLRVLGSREPAQTAGHSPLGALAVLAMLALLAVQGITGLFANDEIFNTGPLYGYVTDGMSDRLTGVHHENFEWLLALIGLHLAAIVFYAVWKRQDLVRPMITGRKRAAELPPGQGLASQRLWLAAVLVAVVSGVLWRVIETAPRASLSFF